MGKSKRGDVHGWVVLDKPLGLTSTQALGKVRRILGASRAGHGGTLDPLATGVLPLAFGEATKTLPFVLDGAKAYRFAVKWGVETTTLDLEGEVTRTSNVRPDFDSIRAILPRFTGTLAQTPPIFSAIKVDGQRAYDLARAGEAVELAPREIVIEALNFEEDRSGVDEAWFHVTCGKGTYVRSLARDLAEALGTVGHVVFLRRTAAGAFREAAAITLEDLSGASLLSLDAALAHLPRVDVSDADAARLRLGQAIDRTAQERIDPALIWHGDAALGIGRLEAGRLHPVRLFRL